MKLLLLLLLLPARGLLLLPAVVAVAALALPLTLAGARLLLEPPRGKDEVAEAVAWWRRVLNEVALKKERNHLI